MISYLKGKVLKRGILDRFDYIDIIVNDSIGYRVFIQSSFPSDLESDNIAVYTSFQVREDSQALYGFSSEQDRDFFELLMTVSGVGPKLAMSILSHFESDVVKTHIINGDHSALSKVSGLGKKGAQKIVVELQSNLEKSGFKRSDMKIVDSSRISELKQALTSLGFKGEQLKQYLERGEKISGGNDIDDVEQLLKLVLKDSD